MTRGSHSNENRPRTLDHGFAQGGKQDARPQALLRTPAQKRRRAARAAIRGAERGGAACRAAAGGARAVDREERQGRGDAADALVFARRATEQGAHVGAGGGRRRAELWGRRRAEAGAHIWAQARRRPEADGRGGGEERRRENADGAAEAHQLVVAGSPADGPRGGASAACSAGAALANARAASSRFAAAARPVCR